MFTKPNEKQMINLMYRYYDMKSHEISFHSTKINNTEIISSMITMIKATSMRFWLSIDFMYPSLYDYQIHFA
jgi:hypothetical protein